MVLLIEKFGEGRKDAVERLEIARLYGSLLTREGLLSDARSIAATVAPNLGLDPDSVAGLDQTQLEKVFSAKTIEQSL
jgi:hypothetical protein